jgi:hypothetical protein
MKKFALVALVSVVALAGCDNGQDKCIKDPTAQGCPRASGNVVSSPSKSWDMNAPANSASQSQGK